MSGVFLSSLVYFVGDTFASVKTFIIVSTITKLIMGSTIYFIRLIISLKICSYFYADTTSSPAV